MNNNGENGRSRPIKIAKIWTSVDFIFKRMIGCHLETWNPRVVNVVLVSLQIIVLRIVMTVRFAFAQFQGLRVLYSRSNVFVACELRLVLPILIISKCEGHIHVESVNPSVLNHFPPTS
jgi:hypothetical protein